MTEYTFRYGPFVFKVIGEHDKEAVFKARRAIEESFVGDSNHLPVELTAGAFLGRLYVETKEITVNDIHKREPIQEEVAPF